MICGTLDIVVRRHFMQEAGACQEISAPASSKARKKCGYYKCKAEFLPKSEHPWERLKMGRSSARLEAGETSCRFSNTGAATVGRSSKRSLVHRRRSIVEVARARASRSCFLSLRSREPSTVRRSRRVARVASAAPLVAECAGNRKSRLACTRLIHQSASGSRRAALRYARV